MSAFESIATLYQQSVFALAAYVDWSAGAPSPVSQLRQAGLSEEQANKFLADYTIVPNGYYTDASGFSSTLFQDAAGNKFLAIRGTEPTSGADLGADAFLAFTGDAKIQLPGLTNALLQFGLLSQDVSGNVSVTPDGQNVTLTGHSLGGHLATIATLKYPGLGGHTRRNIRGQSQNVISSTHCAVN